MSALRASNWGGYQPLTLFVCCFLVGMVIAEFWKLPSALYGGCVLLLLAFWWTGRLGFKVQGVGQTLIAWLEDQRFRTFLLVCAAVMAGSLIRSAVIDGLDVEPEQLTGSEQSRPIVLRGTVLDQPERVTGARQAWNSKTTWKYRIRVEQLRQADKWGVCDARLEVTQSSESVTLLPGDRCQWMGTLRTVSNPRNPGSSDGRNDLQRREIEGRLWVSQREGVEKFGISWAFPYRGFAQWRRHADQRLRACLDNETHSIARAITLGLRDEMLPETTALYREAGIAHLLAISGFHVGILCFVVMIPMSHLGLDRWTSLWTVMLILFVFLGVSGMRPSVQRATLGIGVAMVFRLRYLTPISRLSFVGLLLVLCDPAVHLDLGAQLSFLGVYLLQRAASFLSDGDCRWLVQRTRAQWGWSWSQFHQVLSHYLTLHWITLGVVLGTLPLVAFHFESYATAGIVVTPLVVLPSACLLVGSMLLALPLVGEMLAPGLAPVVEISDAWVTSIAHWGCRWFPCHSAPGPSAGVLCVGYIGLLLVDRISYSREKRGFWFAWLILFNLMVGLEPYVTSGAKWAVADVSQGRITVMDVSHGTAVLIENGRGEAWMYDAGSVGGGHFASRVVLNWLSHRRINVIERLFLSHPDRDHFNGCSALVSRNMVREVVVPEVFRHSKDESWNRLLHQCQQAGIPIVYCSQGDRWHDGFNLDCHVLHPDAVSIHGTDNDKSLVLRVTLAGRKLLLTGDVEGHVSRALADEAGHCDWLLAPHHGGEQSEAERWMKRTQPRWFCVSSKQSKPMAELQKGRVQCWNTAEHGAISFHFRGEQAIVTTWLKP